MDLGDPAAVEAFVQSRGEPYGELKPGHPISSASWVYLSEALQLAAAAWGPPDADGTSYPINDLACISRARSFLEHVGAAPLLAAMAVIPMLGRKFGPGLGLQPRNLAAFLVARAVNAMRPFQPMRRCLTCGCWFEVIRIQREPDFCSASCRAMHTQKGNQDGVIQEEHHQEREPALAKRVVGAGTERPATKADKKPRKPKGSPRPRPAHGTGSRAPRHR